MFPPNSHGNQPQLDPDAIGRTAMIITIALVMGVCSFLAIAVVIRWGDKAGDPFLSYFAAGFSVLMLVLSFVLPRIVTANLLRQSTDAIREDHRRALAGVYQTRVILSRAPLEGAAFFNLVAYIVSGQIWSIGIVVVLLVMMLVPFPSQADFENWADQMRRDLPA